MICCICGGPGKLDHAGFGMVCDFHARQLVIRLQVASPAADTR